MSNAIDSTKIAPLNADREIFIPDRYKDRVIGDRAATAQEVCQAVDAHHADKPVVVWLDAQDLGVLYSQRTTPNEFNQYLLRKLRDAGAPVEGQAILKLAHGAVAKVKPDPLLHEMGFRYIWLSEEYVEVIARHAGH